MSTLHHRTARDLAHLVASKLGAGPRAPTVEELQHLLDIVFLGSLKFEEARPIRCLLTFASATNPDPDPPQMIRMDRWVYVGFEKHLALTPSGLAKIALASDPSTSALAIHCRNGRPLIHGLFDQQRAYQAMLLYERFGGYGPPGVFQIQVLGPGHLKVMQDSMVLGELNDGILAPRTQDALREGPVVEFFTESVRRYLAMLAAEAKQHGKELDDDQVTFEAQEWIRSVRRLLVRARAHSHGASFLFFKSGLGRDLKPRHYWIRSSQDCHRGTWPRQHPVVG